MKKEKPTDLCIDSISKWLEITPEMIALAQKIKADRQKLNKQKGNKRI